MSAMLQTFSDFRRGGQIFVSTTILMRTNICTNNNSQDKYLYQQQFSGPVHAKIEPARADKDTPRGSGDKAGRQVVVKPVIW